MSKALKNKTKLNDMVSVKDFGAVGDGVTDDTAAIQSALDAASGKELHFDGLTYKVVKGAGSYVLTAPADVRLVGVFGKTIIKLATADADCYILGRSAASNSFYCTGITFDGSKSTLSAINVSALYFPEATIVQSHYNTFKDLNDLGLFASKALYVSNTTLGELAESIGDKWTGCEGYPFQTYRIARNFVRDGYAKDVLISFTDINGQTIPSTTHAKTTISGNTVLCDAGFGLSYSVLSLLGNDVSACDNKIYGGATQIDVHSAATETLRNYIVSGNQLWAGVNAITVNQTSGTSATNGNVTVSGNAIYQPSANGISVVGTYAGGTTTSGTAVTISGNTIIDNRTENPSPGAYACIRTLSAVNTTIIGNSIIGPRWAGIYCEYDGRNIVIADNVIADHQGRTSTGFGTGSAQGGGAIFISGGLATAYLGNISIHGNVVRNYCTQASPQLSYTRTGGIVINEAKAQDISVRGNRVMTGNASGISLLSCVNVTVEDNDVTGFFSEALNTSNGVGAGCLLTYAITGSRYGTTRPTLQSTQAGYQFYDASLTKPIFWNGSDWRDVNNVAV